MDDIEVRLSPVDINDKDLKYIDDAMRSGWLAHGEYNKLFEKEFEKKFNIKNAITLNSCTSALDIAIKINDFPKGSEVIVPSFTWVSTANVVCLNNLTPVFVDINFSDFQIDVDKVAAAINKNTVAIIGVHFSGLLCDITSLQDLAKQNNLIFIEDSAECLGVTRDGFYPGQKGIGCFSFYPTKNMTTCEGGMLTFNYDNDQHYIKAKGMSSHGVIKSTYENFTIYNNPWNREALFPGLNYRMPNPLAALGYSQLNRFDQMLRRRKEIAKVYEIYLEKYDFIHLPQYKNSTGSSSYQMFVCFVDNKNKTEVINSFRNYKIEVSSHFDPPLHLQKAFKDNSIIHDKLTITEKVSKNIISLPISSSLPDEGVEKVVNAIKKVFG